MSENTTEVKVVQEKEKSLWQKTKERLGKPTKQSLTDSERFSRLGYIQYPRRQQLDHRVKDLSSILDSVEADLDEIDRKMMAGEPIPPGAYAPIKKLFRAFMVMGSPWFRGLDNRELAKKAVAFFRLETLVGHIPSFYPDLKFCTETLINLSWQAVDVIAETPVQFETKVSVLPSSGASPLNPNPQHIGRGKKNG